MIVSKGGAILSISIVIQSSAYTDLITEARNLMPSETVGALIGSRQSFADDRQWVTVREVMPGDLVLRGVGLTPSLEAWEAHRNQIQRRDGTKQVVGWFYADPGMGIFPSRLDIAEAAKLFCHDGDLFLLVNPFTDQGAFYIWEQGAFKPAGGFYEGLPNERAVSVVPWDGQVLGAPRWLPTPPPTPAVENAEQPVDKAGSLNGRHSVSGHKETDSVNNTGNTDGSINAGNIQAKAEQRTGNNASMGDQSSIA